MNIVAPCGDLRGEGKRAAVDFGSQGVGTGRFLGLCRSGRGEGDEGADAGGKGNEGRGGESQHG